MAPSCPARPARRAPAPDQITNRSRAPSAGAFSRGPGTPRTWHHSGMRSRALRALGTAAVLGGTAFAYGSVAERNWFALRRYDVPVLPPGAAPLRVLHISDAHLTPGRKRLMAWVRSLDELDPHLVINTGDSISHPQSVPCFLDALGPLLDRPGAFVLGSNDMYAPEPHNPARYLMGPSSRWRIRKEPD